MRRLSIECLNSMPPANAAYMTHQRRQTEAARTRWHYGNCSEYFANAWGVERSILIVSGSGRFVVYYGFAMGASYNFAAAFVEFCKGTSLDDISLALAIPITRLKSRAHGEGWSMLAPALPAAPTTCPAERDLARINENRERNLAIARQLQEDLGELIGKLRDGTLKLTRVFANGLQTEVDPSIRDRADLANYAKNVAEMSYRAIGDVEKSRNAPGEAGNSGPQQITIVLPPAVAAPREMRAYDIASQVVTNDTPSAPPPEPMALLVSNQVEATAEVVGAEEPGQ